MITVVTGASGALGKAVCEYLGANGHDVAPVPGVDLSDAAEATSAIARLAADRGMAVMINRGFGGGRIFEKVGDQPLPDWAAEFASSWAQFLLKYALSHPAATVAIPGMTKARHVDDNLMEIGRTPD